MSKYPRMSVDVEPLYNVVFKNVSANAACVGHPPFSVPPPWSHLRVKARQKCSDASVSFFEICCALVDARRPLAAARLPRP
jgi:hypothetical protein